MPEPFTMAIYNPALLKKEDLVARFVARQNLLERLLDDLRREEPGSAPQHHLIIGQRGFGKTTLLHRLAFAVEDDPVLAKTWMALVFPEEQYNVSSLADVWLNCVDALSDALDRTGQRAASKALDARVAKIPASGADRSAAALNLLIEEADRLGRRILLLVDNIDIILERLKEDLEWEFRRVISHEPRLGFIGASSRVLEAFYEHGRAFYDFFQIHELKGFDEDETLSTLCQLADQSGNAKVAELVRRQPGRIKAVRVLTGGNPRTLALLFKVLAQGPDGDVQRDIEQLLDEHTALYKARFEELAPQAQQLIDAMAIHWDPLTAADLAELLGPLNVNQVSAQLKRLEDFGVVEKTPWFGEKKNAFQIAERFFNIWYLMRASRRVRRRLLWLVKFLETWFDQEELSARARHFLERDPGGLAPERYAEMALAYSQAVPDRHLRRSLESAGLHAVLDDGVRRLIDFSDLPAEALDKKERMQQLRDLRETTRTLGIDWSGIEPAEFWQVLGGSPYFSLQEKARMLEQLTSLSAASLGELYEKLKLVRQRLREYYRREVEDVNRLYQALAGGDMADVYDYENAIAVAKRYGLRRLPFIGIRSRTDPRLNSRKLSEDETSMAESALRAMTSEEGFEAMAWDGLGNLLRERLNRYGEAEQAYRHAIELDAQSSDSWNCLGNLLQYDLARYREAEAAYRRAMELDPASPWPWNGLGNLLRDRLGRDGEAEETYRRAIELDPGLSYSWNNLGDLLMDRLGRYEEAETAYRRAIELDPQFAWPWNNLGDLLMDGLGRYEDAETAYRRAIELDPQFARPWNNLGILLKSRLGRYEEAESAYRRAIELDPQFAWPWHNLGILLRDQLGRYEEAETAYRRAIELDSRDAEPWNNLGNLLMNKLARYNEAERAYRRAIELNPHYALPWNGLGVLLQDHLERYGEAEQAYRRSIDLDSQLAHPWSNLGIMLERLFGRDIESAEAFLRAYELDSERLSDLEGFARVCARLAESPNELPAALDMARRALELAPDAVEVRFLRARILALAGRWQEAAPLLEQLSAEESTFYSRDFFRDVVKTGHLDDAITILERTGADERWRPLYAALRAARAGTPDYLRTVAPEVREAATQILRELNPELFADTQSD
jgi:tetratricopeptide (TPR) repeat protein